jgi:16S rRNA (cytosine967-C5)-methyltransferase
MKFVSHLNTAMHILQQYKGDEPFVHFIKKNFQKHKKFGSTDRRTISHLCYYYFRLGQALKNVSIEEKVLIAVFLCEHLPNKLLTYFRPEWNESINVSLAEKLSIIHHTHLIPDIFPWHEELSNGIDYQKFCESFLIQPDLFLRLRPGNEEIVMKKLLNSNIKFRLIGDSCITLSNATKIDEVIQVNKEAVIQDYSSQQVGNFLQVPSTNLNPHGFHPTSTIRVWDCCAASGGKSILVKDTLGNINLSVSDIRESILINLKKRFGEAGIKKYESFAADFSSAFGHRSPEKFDLIIADVPCTGSGTWGRSPEALSFFDTKEIETYSALQKKIISNVIPSLKGNGRLVYLTCSVFKGENEGMVDFILKNFSLELERMEVLTGYDKKADTMFAAAFCIK